MYVCLVQCSPNHPLVAVRDLEPHIIYPAPGSSSGSGGGLSSVHQSPYALRRKLSPPEPSSPCSSSTGLTTTETHSLLPRKRQRRVFSSSQSAPDGEWNFYLDWIFYVGINLRSLFVKILFLSVIQHSGSQILLIGEHLVWKFL